MTPLPTMSDVSRQQKRVLPREALRRHAKAIGQGIIKRAESCPWNPFPPSSPWGQVIEEGYRRGLSLTATRRSRLVLHTVIRNQVEAGEVRPLAPKDEVSL